MYDDQNERTQRKVRERIAQHFYEKYKDQYSHITMKDYKILTRGGGNIFSFCGMRKWLKSTIPHITPEVLANIREDSYTFLMCERHTTDFCVGYVPLAERRKSLEEKL
ncbi:MAG: hypothetical protein Q7S74_02700 [Nanoarchaeota archaeon]|nr:hypothetical protein [Nanoarchaeota archaeon]